MSTPATDISVLPLCSCCNFTRTNYLLKPFDSHRLDSTREPSTRADSGRLEQNRAELSSSRGLCPSQELGRKPVGQTSRKRAGVFLYNPKENKILIVQVFNKFIGIPKGGQEENETTSETALRELQEETGISLDSLNENSKIIFNGNCTYYLVETSECFKTTLNKFDENDVSGVGWVHPKCISKIPGRITSHLDRMIRYIHRIHPSLGFIPI